MRVTRSKRKLEQQLEDPPANKARCFSNITNVKSPKSRKSVKPSAKLTDYFKPQSDSGEDVQTFKMPPVVKKTSKTKVKVEATKTSETPASQEISSQPVFSQISTQQLPSGVKDVGLMAQTVKQVLKRNMMDASQRLQLEIIPCHLYDLKRYLQTQKQPLHFTSSINQNVCKNFLAEERFYQFIHLVRAMCGQREFPGSKVARSVLELILVSL